MGNFAVFLFALYALHHFFLKDVITSFQTKFWPRVQNGYKNMVRWCLNGWKPAAIFAGGTRWFVFSIVFTGIRQPPVVFFPNGDPNFIFTYVRMPIGTDQVVTDSITSIVENRVINTLGEDNKVVEPVISNVAIGASEDPFDAGVQSSPHLGKVTVAFVKFAERDGQSTRVYLDSIRNAVAGIKGAEVSVSQEQNGPPTGKPINIEISAEDFDLLTSTPERGNRYLDPLQTGGVEELKSDFQADKPEIVINIDREKANREGISTGQIGRMFRTAIYGLEISKFRDENDDYPIQLRVKESQRNNINTLMNLPVTYRDMAMNGAVRQVPLSAIATVEYSNTFAGIKRIDQKRVITLSSNVLTDYNANAVVADIEKHLAEFSAPDGVEIRMTGEQEDQKETSDFLGIAFIAAFALIFMI